MFSIRRKIMLLLSLISFCSSAIFLVFSIRIFQKDKIAYIYDSNNTYLETISNQFKSEVASSSEILKKYLIDYQKKNSFHEDNRKNLEDDSILNGIELFDITQDTKPIDKLIKINIDSDFLSRRAEFQQAIQKLKSEHRVLFFIDDTIVIGEVVYDQKERIVCFSYFQSEALKNFFDTDKSYSGFVIESGGRVLQHPKDLSANFLTEKFSQYFTKADAVKMGTTEIESIDDQKWLLASASLGFDDIYLVTLTNKKSAFSVLTNLINKSVIVFFMILSGVVIISLFASSAITERLSKLYNATKEIISGNFNVHIDVQGNDEISMLTLTFNKMSEEITKLLDETAQKARIESELKTAQAVQQTLLPKPYYKFKNAEIKGCYNSASECGGDWWHYYENDESIWVWIADATGHGASAALLTSAIKSAVAMTEMLKLEPALVAEMVNKSICQISKENMMMTCFVGIINKRTLHMKYINASHEAPIVLKKQDGLKKRDLIFLDDKSSPRFGQSSESQYLVNEYQLERGDRILMYTDGVPDIRNPQGENLGERGFLKIILSHHNAQNTASEFIDQMYETMESYREKSELIDDVTFFAVDFL